MRYPNSNLFTLPSLLVGPIAKFRAGRRHRRLEMELATMPDYLIRDMGLDAVIGKQFKNLDS